MDFEKKYWSNGEFSNNGIAYYGYVGIYEEKPYIYDTEEPLEISNTFSSKVNISDKFFDRILSEKLELPYKKEDVVFAANDFLSAAVVKTIVERLQENNLYLFRNSILPNSILPVNDNISLYATEDITTYYYSYIDYISKEIKIASENALFENGSIYDIDENEKVVYVGECVYSPNESYIGDLNDAKKYRGEGSKETAADSYKKLYFVKNSEYSHIPKISSITDIISGKLKRYSFSDKGLTAKTHIDPCFYSQNKFKDVLSVKTINGVWEETLSNKVVLEENTERDPSCAYWNNFNAYSNKADIYNIINDVWVDIDDETLEDITDILKNSEAGKNEELYLAERYYDNLSGEYINGEVLAGPADTQMVVFRYTDIYEIWDSFVKTYEDRELADTKFNLRIKKMSFLLKLADPNDIPNLYIGVENKADSISYVKTNDGFYHVTYYFSEGVKLANVNNSWFFIPHFDKDITTALSPVDSKLKYTISLSYGTRIPGIIGESEGKLIGEDMRFYKKVPVMRRQREYNWLWTDGSLDPDTGKYKIFVASLPTMTYRYLKETPEWVNGIASRLIYMNELDEGLGSNNKLISYTPNDDMTAEDCYIFMTNNLLSYKDFPYIERKTKYSYILKNGQASADFSEVSDLLFVENTHYKRLNYNMETFAFLADEEGNSFIGKTYKSASEAHRELNEENGKNNKKYFDFIPTFKAITISISDSEPPKHNFAELTNAEMHIIKRSEDGTYLDILLFLMFKNKVLITKVKHYINEEENFENESAIDLRGLPGENYIVIDCVDPNNKNSLSFKNLTDIKLHKNMLYISDGELNMVMRYDVEYLISPEEEHSFDIKSIQLLDVLQGDGEISDKIYFNNPFAIAASDDRVYIVDRGNRCIKVYSPSLNYIKILKNGYYATHDIQAVAVNPYAVTLEDGTKLGKDSLWVFSANNSNIYLSIIDNDAVVSYGQIEDIRLISDKYSWVEEFKNIEFSAENSNYYYIATTKRVYKLQTSKPFYPLGSLSYFKQRSSLSNMVWGRMNYRWTKLPKIYTEFGDNFGETNEVTWAYRPPMSSAEILDNRCFTLCGLDGISDQFNGSLIFHLGTLYDENKINQYIKANNHRFNGNMTFADIPVSELVPRIKSFNMLFYIEPDSYISSLNNNFINIYDTKVDDIVFEDYINAFSFNKMIYGVVYNLLSIKNQIISNFKAATNLDGIIVYDSTILTDYFKKLELGNEANYFVHDNEVISIVANRVFESIHNLQQKILDNMQTKFMAAQSFVNNTSRII